MLLTSLIVILAFSVFMGASAGTEELNIPIKKAPYKVLIVQSKNHSQVIGSGAILSQRWAITTATCIKDHRGMPNTLMVRSGSGIYNSDGGLHFVKKIVVHPDFVGQGSTRLVGQGDVALLRLIYEFHLSLTVAPIPLPQHVTPAGTTSHVISWPLFGGKRSTTLKALTVSTTNWIECRKTLSKQTGVTLGETTLCTTPLNKFQAQEGDPLVTSGTLTGLYKNANLKPELPEFYVDVSSFMPWIEEKIEE